MKATELALSSSLGCEWDDYCGRLSKAGIMLNDESDRLVWSYNPTQGIVTAELAYKMMLEEVGGDPISGIRKFLWSSKLPFKVACFIWLCLDNKILT